MGRPHLYLRCIAWIASNDDAVLREDEDRAEVAEQISTVLVADVFDLEPLAVAADVIALRKAEDARERKTRGE